VDWLREDVTREQVAQGLLPLLALPVELVLPPLRAARVALRSHDPARRAPG
jgi:hypothetical protein